MFFAKARRANRARKRVAQYQADGDWTAEHGRGTVTFTGVAEIASRGRFEPTTAGLFNAYRADMDRKHGHAPTGSYFIGMERSDGTLWVIWWVMRDSTGNYSGLKPYYFLTRAEQQQAQKEKVEGLETALEEMGIY